MFLRIAPEKNEIKIGTNLGKRTHYDPQYSTENNNS